MDYLSELTRIAQERVPAPVYPDPVPRLDAEIRAKREEIANLRKHRPASKREYLDSLERLESELADLIVQDNQIRDDNAAARSAVDADYLAAIEAAKQDPDNQWAAIRIVRNRLLAECDWTQIPDAPLTEEQKEAWREYRQALRDIPQTFATPGEVMWPTPPEMAATLYNTPGFTVNYGGFRGAF